VAEEDIAEGREISKYCGEMTGKQPDEGTKQVLNLNVNIILLACNSKRIIGAAGITSNASLAPTHTFDSNDTCAQWKRMSPSIRLLDLQHQKRKASLQREFVRHNPRYSPRGGSFRLLGRQRRHSPSRKAEKALAKDSNAAAQRRATKIGGNTPRQLKRSA
jgi:hypothetical protein